MSVVSCPLLGLGRHAGWEVFLIAWYFAWEHRGWLSFIALCCAWELCGCRTFPIALSPHSNSTSAGLFLRALRCAWEQWDSWAFLLTLWTSCTGSVVPMQQVNVAITGGAYMIFIVFTDYCCAFKLWIELGYCVILMGDRPWVYIAFFSLLVTYCAIQDVYIRRWPQQRRLLARDVTRGIQYWRTAIRWYISCILSQLFHLKKCQEIKQSKHPSYLALAALPQRQCMRYTTNRTLRLQSICWPLWGKLIWQLNLFIIPNIFRIYSWIRK